MRLAPMKCLLMLVVSVAATCKQEAELSEHSQVQTCGSVLVQKATQLHHGVQVIKASDSTLWEDPPKVLSWDGTTLAAVRQLLMDPESDEAKHFVPAQKELLRQAEKLAGLPANLRTGVPAGPWSPTQKALTPPSGDKRDFMTISGYAWPCTKECKDTGYSEDKCALWDSGTRTFGPCDASTDKPWVMHDGFLNYDNLQDTQIMIVAMDSLETLTLGWWFDPLGSSSAPLAHAAMRVFRSYFLNTTTRINPRFLYGDSIPGKYDNGTAGALIAPNFRMNARFADCATLLQMAGPDIWTEQDTEAWLHWSREWSEWLKTSKFGKIELAAVGNHGTFAYIHKLALANITGDSASALQLVSKLRTDLPASLAEQIEPSGEMPIETARVTGAIYSLMNLEGLFMLGTVVQNICKTMSCDPPWDWSWQAPTPTSARWDKYAERISYCKYKGRATVQSVRECKSACEKHSECNGVVVRTKEGTIVGCYFKKCAGTTYDLRTYAPGKNIYDSYHMVTPPPEGSGSLRKALDYLLPFALGKRQWTEVHPGTKADNAATRWKHLAAMLQRAAVVFRNTSYLETIAHLDANFDVHRYNLLFPRPASSF